MVTRAHHIHKKHSDGINLLVPSLFEAQGNHYQRGIAKPSLPEHFPTIPFYICNYF